LPEEFLAIVLALARDSVAYPFDGGNRQFVPNRRLILERRAGWFTIRSPLSSRRALVLKIGAFVLPLLTWCIVSYVPFVWHPKIRLTDVGDSVLLTTDQLWDPATVQKENKELIAAGEKPAVGVRANPVFLPAPHEVLKAFYTAFATPPSEGEPWLHEALWHSIKIIFWGFITSAIVGVPIGILCGTFDFFSKLIEPFVDFIRYMPAPAFGALCVAVLDIYDGPKIAIIWIGTFFQMVLVVANTTRQLDVGLLEAAQTLGARRHQLLAKVILPGILPNLFNDMRILIGWAWTYLIVAELIGASSGISHFISLQGRHFHFDNVFAAIIMIGIIGLVCDQVLATFGQYLFPWLPGSNKSGVMNAIFGAVLFLPQRLLLKRSRERRAIRDEMAGQEIKASPPNSAVVSAPMPGSGSAIINSASSARSVDVAIS
jgi:NitT/TauT family transport system permease protein